jgi:hypothetical protein
MQADLIYRSVIREDIAFIPKVSKRSGTYQLDIRISLFYQIMEILMLNFKGEYEQLFSVIMPFDYYVFHRHG